jgi:hypothetical protein
MSRRLLSALFAASLLGGLVLMLGFDRPATRIAGVACLLAFVVAGVFLVADPEFLAADREG